MTPLVLIAAGFVAGVWIVYPLVVALLGVAMRRRRPALPSPAPTVSVVLATREPLEDVRRRVDDLVRADYDLARLQIVIARDPRASALSSAAFRVPAGVSVVVVTGDEPGGKAAALNAGVRAATGDVLVFTDTHQRFAASALGLLAAATVAPGFGAASGRLSLREEHEGLALSPSDLYWRYERWLRRNEARVHSTVGVTGAIYAMRRALWTPLPAGLLLDDVFVPMRLVLDGHRVDFVEEARATETRSVTPGQEYRRKVRTLTGVLQLCAWLPAVLSPARNRIWAQFVIHKLLRLLTPYAVVTLVVAGAIVAAQYLAVHPIAAALLGAGALATLVVPRGFALARRLVVGLAVVQAAAVVATVNGLRGRWDVWRA